YSLVHYACENGQEKMLYSLLLKKADPGKAASDGSLPIHLCARKGYDVCLTQLLEHGADPIIPNTLGQTALDIAMANNKFDIVNLLKALNIHELTKNGEIDAIRHAATQGCNLDRTHPKTGFAPLDNGAKYCTLLQCEELVGWWLEFLNETIPVNVCIATPLRSYYAAERGNLDIMRLLLENGADPNRSEPTTFTALYAAINKGQNEAVKLLLEWGADPNQVVGNVDPAKRSFGTSPLAAAIKKGSVELVELLLETEKVAITSEEFKAAFEKKSKPFVKRLMKALSPDFPERYQIIWELRSSNGESLVQHFARKGDVKMLELAKEFRANFSERFASVLLEAPVDHENNEGGASAGSALNLAALSGKDKAVTWLIDKAHVPIWWEGLAKLMLNLCKLKTKIVPVMKILMPHYERLMPELEADGSGGAEDDQIRFEDLFAEAVKTPNYQLVQMGIVSPVVGIFVAAEMHASTLRPVPMFNRYFLEEHKSEIDRKRLRDRHGPHVISRSDSLISLSNSMASLDSFGLDGGLLVDCVKAKDIKVLRLLVEFLDGGLLKLNQLEEDSWNVTQAIDLTMDLGAMEIGECNLFNIIVVSEPFSSS
ncbi:hypothetical protein FOL47_000286, partial [Perkinsus chesapeaki]